VERLIGTGHDVRVLDGSVSFARIHGANRAYIEREIPHITSLMVDDLEAILDHAEVIVVGNSSPEFGEVLQARRPGQQVIDLVRMGAATGVLDDYEGIAW
jgi:GDP-mannose 6-dehydrogenase